MAWFWTDDLARALVEAGEVERSSVMDWVERPIAIAASEGAEPLDVARETLGIVSRVDAGAA